MKCLRVPMGTIWLQPYCTQLFSTRTNDQCHGDESTIWGTGRQRLLCVPHNHPTTHVHPTALLLLSTHRGFESIHADDSETNTMSTHRNKQEAYDPNLGCAQRVGAKRCCKGCRAKMFDRKKQGKKHWKASSHQTQTLNKFAFCKVIRGLSPKAWYI